MRNSQSVNLVDLPTVRKFTQDLFYPAPVAKGAKSSASASPKPTATKLNFAHQANGKGVNGSSIPCVN